MSNPPSRRSSARSRTERIAVTIGFAFLEGMQAYLRFRYGMPVEHADADAEPTMPQVKPEDLAALGLTQIPTERELLAAWRETAKRTHPDVGGDAGRFNAALAARDRIAQYLKTAPQR